MKKYEGSVTALVTAYIRASHSPTAKENELFSDEEKIFFSKIMPTLPVNSTTTVKRSQYTEEKLSKSLSEGIRQYVILGAGFDTFAFREKKLNQKLQIFEVDLSKTQQEKLKRIKRAKWEIPENLNFVATDFNEDDLKKKMIAKGYNPKIKTFFSLLGVTYYLPKESVLKNLKTISDIAPQGSIVVFDYLDEDAFTTDKASNYMKKMKKIVERSGEPMITGFAPNKLGEEIANTGFVIKENISVKNKLPDSSHFHFALAVK